MGREQHVLLGSRPRPEVWRAPWCRSLAAISLVLAFSVGCAQGQAATTSATAMGTPMQQVATAMSPTVVPSATAMPIATTVPSPAVTPTSVATVPAASSTRPTGPTSTAAGQTAPTPAPLYRADFASWDLGDQGEPYPAHLSFDAGTHEYHVALADPSRAYVYVVYEPEPKVFQDFRLDVDVHRAAGPEHGSFGIVVGAQARGAGDSTNPRYNVLIRPDDQHFSVNRIPGSGHGEVVGDGTSTAIKAGGAINHLQIIGTGDTIAVSINGQSVGRYSSAMTTSGQIGLIVLSPMKPAGPAGMEAAFGNLTISPSATEKG